jgi:hypothetical protein
VSSRRAAAIEFRSLTCWWLLGPLARPLLPRFSLRFSLQVWPGRFGDNESWQLIRLFRNDYPAAIGVGISTQSPLGEGTSAVFEDVSLTKQSISDFRRGI